MEPFASYAQNAEDVVLHRALGGVEEGRYIEVGANDPTVHSITKAFYLRGWSGITIEPVQALAEKHRAERPRDLLVEAAIADTPGDKIVLHQIDDSGLSSTVDSVGTRHRSDGWNVTDVEVPARRLDDILQDAGWEGVDIHFMTIDTEGSEESVLRTIDLRRWRPWVIVIEATEPLTTQPSHDAWEKLITSAGYTMVLFDGLSRFYVAAEHREELGARLGYPACVHDVFDTPHIRDLRAMITRLDGERAGIAERKTQLEQENGALQQSVTDLRGDRDRLKAELAECGQRQQEAFGSALRWRTKAVSVWAQAAAPSAADHDELLFLREHAHALFTELSAMRQTVSWRVTGPLRKVRTLAPRRDGG